MTLFVVGLGLADEKDITVRGLECVRRSSRVFLEQYTSILLCDTQVLEDFYGRKIEIADRELVEGGSDVILDAAESDNASFLVVGDPFGATTHTDLMLRARERGITVEVVHNASIMNAVGACGLQLYNFGQTVSLVFFTETWKPDSFYDRVREQSLENMARGRRVYEPPRYMSVATACKQLLEICSLKGEAGEDTCYNEQTLAVGVARIGARDQRIVAGTLKQLASTDLGPPLHALVLIGDKVHPLELEFLKADALDSDAIQSSIDLLNR